VTFDRQRDRPGLQGGLQDSTPECRNAGMPNAACAAIPNEVRRNVGISPHPRAVRHSDGLRRKSAFGIPEVHRLQ